MLIYRNSHRFAIGRGRYFIFDILFFPGADFLIYKTPGEEIEAMGAKGLAGLTGEHLEIMAGDFEDHFDQKELSFFVDARNWTPLFNSRDTVPKMEIGLKNLSLTKTELMAELYIILAAIVKYISGDRDRSLWRPSSLYPVGAFEAMQAISNIEI